jgi:anti-anti-sigma factor
MEVIRKSVGGSVVLTPIGRIELTTAEPFREQLLAALDALGGAPGAVVVDCAHLDYVSSAGLRALMVASKAAKARGLGLGIAAMQPVVREIFAISRFELVIACFESVRDAFAALDPPAVDALAAPG